MLVVVILVKWNTNAHLGSFQVLDFKNGFISSCLYWIFGAFVMLSLDFYIIYILPRGSILVVEAN